MDIFRAGLYVGLGGLGNEGKFCVCRGSFGGYGADELFGIALGPINLLLLGWYCVGEGMLSAKSILCIFIFSPVLG